MVAIVNFPIFAENGKTQNWSISSTIGDETILSKLLMYRVSKQYNLLNCQNNFALVKNMSYLEFFVILPKKAKPKLFEDS